MNTSTPATHDQADPKKITVIDPQTDAIEQLRTLRWLAEDSRTSDDQLIDRYIDDEAGTDAGLHALEAIGGFKALRDDDKPGITAARFSRYYVAYGAEYAPADQLTCTRDAIGGVIDDLYKRYELRRQSRHEFIGHATQIAPLDQLLGGLEQARVTMLLAAPGIGKTTLANQIAYTVAKANPSADHRTPVVYVTYENEPADLIVKHMARSSNVNPADIQRGAIDPKRFIDTRTIVADEARSLYYVNATATTSVASIASALTEAMQQHPNGGHPLLIIDYLQQLARAGRGGEDIRTRVGNVSRELSDLAKASRAHVLAISSMNRAGYANGAKPSQASAKESGDLEFDASAVITLQADQEAHAGLHHDSLILSVVKNRYGSCGTVRLTRDRTTLQITEVK